MSLISPMSTVTMNALNLAIKEAYQASGALKEANKAYLEFIKANFIIPIEHGSEDDPKVLFLQEETHTFLPVFTQMTFLDAWASEITQKVQLLRLSGIDLLKGLGDNVSVCLDIGSEFYKELAPEELARMRSMVLKLF